MGAGSYASPDSVLGGGGGRTVLGGILSGIGGLAGPSNTPR